MNDEWKKFIQEEMEREAELIMQEVNSDPAMKDVKAPEGMYESLMEQIREYEEEQKLAHLTEEERELLRLGKIYRKRRKLSRWAVLIAAAVALFAIGTISMGENESILQILSRYLLGDEQVVSDSGSIEPIKYIDEEEVYVKIDEEYGFVPVKLEYLPEDTEFLESDFYSDMQEVYMYYGVGDEANLIYCIKPNYRESSHSTVIEDEKKQEYTMGVNDTVITVKEYLIAESSNNRWLVTWVYQDVQYTLNITGEEQNEVEQIVNSLRLFE